MLRQPIKKLGISLLAAVMALYTVVCSWPLAAGSASAADAASYKFDFGTASSPVMAGYTRVSESLLYTAELGYGLDQAVSSRYRAGTSYNDLLSDFVTSYGFTFMADVPNGVYDVTVYSGDPIGTSATRMRVSLEGGTAENVEATAGTVTSKTIRATVADGQLNVNFIRWSSTSGGVYVNALDIVSVPPQPPAAPTELAVASATQDGVSLQWSAVADAALYNVYRADLGSEAAAVPIGQTASASYTDTSITVGQGYMYYVSAINANGLESALSQPVTVDAIAAPQPPQAPTGLSAGEVTDSAIKLAWNAVSGAISYEVHRADTPTGEFALIGTSSTNNYTDTTADTSVAHYYQVRAVNNAGASNPSETAVSSTYTPPASLPEGELRFDFGPGAVADGYIQVQAATRYSASLKYGFADPSVVTGTDRGTADALKSDYVMPQNTSFLVDLPNADYTVSLIAGDATDATNIAIKVENIQKVQQTAKAAGEYLSMSFDIALVDGQLNFEFTGTAPKINALIITKKPDRQPGDLPTVYIAGDSTVQTYDPYWKPEAGWGQMLPRFFTDSVIFKNHAIGGRSSKSFINEGRLDEVLRQIRPGDYFLVQFGHNDATISVPERYASPADYSNYLKTYINGARQRGATPILVTPMGRRDYNADTGKFNVSFPEYVAAMKQVAAELAVPYVDLSALSVAYYDSIGFAATTSVFLYADPGVYEAFPNGSADNTHFQEYGAIQLARLLAGGIQTLGLPLSNLVREIEPPAEVPAQPTGLVAGSVSNAGAVLKWNESAGTDIYRVYRKLSTAADYAMIGTSTVPTITIGGMAEGLSYDVRVTAVNGKGESVPSDSITVKTKSAQYRYDFGPVGAPLMAGYTEVNKNILYTSERGYGLTSSTGMDSRDRGAVTDNLRRDFVIYFGGSYEFKVDLPNGYYSVKTYTGDWIGSTRTNVNIEGKDYGTIASGKANIAEKMFNGIAVKDGQMNLVFSGQTAHLNGVEITPLLLAPTDLKLDELQLDSDPASAKLSWTMVGEAVKYNVYRQSAAGGKAVLLGETTAASFVDTSADIGLEYDYTVTAVDSTGFESVASNSLRVSMVDASVSKAASPSSLALQSINKNDLTINWQSVEGARFYYVYRSEKENGVYELLGKTLSASYTDTTVLTTIPYYYKVASVNAGGISDPSASLATPAVTKLSRDMEYLDRSPVAIHTDNGNYIGWRMLGLDPAAIAFNVYRDGVKLNDAPITDSTNWLDAAGTNTSSYVVKSVIGGLEKTVTAPFGVWEKQYKSIPLQKPADDYTKDGQPYTYSAGDANVGDLDGDGQYEIVMMWNPSNAKDNSQAGYTGIVYLDAYEMDGTRLWRINLGPNIRAGAHYTQFMLYDLDGDGKAEVSMKTADGTIDGKGKVIGDASADYRNSSGYVLLGNEYLTVFEGATGGIITTVPYDPPRGDVSAWGDAYGNRVDRFLAAIAYLDGEHPSLVMTRGYYTRTVLAAYDFKNGQLTQRWRFDTNDEGYASYMGQGNHNLSVADVDGDGKDEITFGAMAINDNGKPLYNTGLGHGDAIHLGDHIPSRPGLEVFDVHEHTDSPYGLEMRDAASGEIIWGVHTGMDTGRGVSDNIDPRYPGSESWAATIVNEQHIPITGIYTTDGTLITTNIPSSTNFTIWWDGDLTRELLDANRIDKWDYVNEKTDNLLTATGASSNNGTKANPMLQADLFGDWREEVIWRATDSSEMRIYSTVDVTETRIHTLMHDPVYRLGIAWQNVGYNQPPHTSFYIGDDMQPVAQPSIRYTNDPTILVNGVTVTSEGGVTTIMEGDSLQLQAAVEPSNASDRNIAWFVQGIDGSDTELATITADGKLSAAAAGTVVVKAAAVDGSGIFGQLAIQIVAKPVITVNGNQIHIQAQPINGLVSVALTEEQMNLAIQAANKKSVVVALDGGEMLRSVDIQLPVNDASAEQDGIDSIVIQTAVASAVIPVDKLTEEGASLGTLRWTAEAVDASQLPSGSKEQIGGYPVYAFNLYADGQALAEFWHDIEVTIPYALQPGEKDNKIAVYAIGADGQLTTVNGSILYDDQTGTATFNIDHPGLYAAVNGTNA